MIFWNDFFWKGLIIVKIIGIEKDEDEAHIL